ncbi:MAG: 50S ribosomal protein L25 [Thermodesulfobacteriota bacterium]|nr:50S ribosomal protein L25 [Thermodesulfobacteriota bacterium]
MDANVNLTAAPRTTTGKGAARQLRRQGRIPAVFYGRRQQARSLSVNSKDLKTVIMSGGGKHSLIRLMIEDNDSHEEKTVMLKEHQVDPVNRTLVHADFYEVEADRFIEVEVPFVLVGKPKGVDEGGLLQQIRRVLLVSALPQNLPGSIELDVSHLDIGDSIHVEEVQAPEGVEILFDVNFTLATVVSPKGLQAEEEAVEEEEGEAEVGGDGEKDTESAEEDETSS